MPGTISIETKTFANSRQNSCFYYFAGNRLHNDILTMPEPNSIEIKTFFLSRQNSCFHYIAGTQHSRQYIYNSLMPGIVARLLSIAASMPRARWIGIRMFFQLPAKYQFFIVTVSRLNIHCLYFNFTWVILDYRKRNDLLKSKVWLNISDIMNYNG